jgi:hypothetical protein
MREGIEGQESGVRVRERRWNLFHRVLSGWSEPFVVREPTRWCKHQRRFGGRASGPAVDKACFLLILSRAARQSVPGGNSIYPTAPRCGTLASRAFVRRRRVGGAVRA